MSLQANRESKYFAASVLALLSGLLSVGQIVAVGPDGCLSCCQHHDEWMLWAGGSQAPQWMVYSFPVCKSSTASNTTCHQNPSCQVLISVVSRKYCQTGVCSCDAVANQDIEAGSMNGCTINWTEFGLGATECRPATSS